ncbi:flagellar hook-associated protein 2 [Clostridium tetanomorphum]|uniref:flagellar filament capping protein FliD n=1 Tax=Clostridium tetanomorphum TaxID=1553 RepID=UPI000445B74A|nr:flagellar filament capping protein FliD [Clostridium tetanomorphum]KAJ53505.1 flagellar cap protein fliD [Clostridium tetanomorphum DSM 665]MBP1865262.1 flagellar hook-associated protein 2 [Clostridium tetanomorphum]NRS85185.1 flagellar hook-associated protein 2 [Clostridium tetanomorphum]SQC03106.1 flagellar cap protein fliD [Clostridium tetanomorphum]
MSDSISGLSGTGGGDMMRIIGMASGMDIDGMIKKMMLAEQKKVDKVKQQRQQIVWKQEIYKDIIKDVKDLQNTYFRADSEESLLSSKAYSDFKVNSTNSTVATATATVGAVQGNYSVKVNQLAEGATANSDKLITTSAQEALLTTKLSEIGITDGSKFTITSDSKTVEITVGSNQTISDLISQIKNTKWDGKDSLVGNDIDVSFSELTHTFTMKTKVTGEDKNLQISDVSGNFVSKLNLQGKNIDGVTGNIVGQNADVIITPPGGAGVPVTKTTNNFTIDGIGYNLTAVGESTITITPDVDKTFDRFKNFIDKYNTLIDKINTKLTEKKNYDYKPLTDAQKKEMKDDEIKAWEEKAKKGILRNDDNLTNMLSELRNTFFSKVDGASVSFGKSIGLDTEGKVSKAGQIKFTDDTGEIFKNMLKERPDEIMQLFTGTYKLTSDDNAKIDELFNTGLTGEDQEKYGYLKSRTNKVKDAKDIFSLDNSGIFQKFDSILKNNVGIPGVTLNSAILTQYANKQEDYSIYGTSGTNTLPDQIYRKDNLIKTLNAKLKDKENALYKKFSRLEVVMNKYNAQTSWLAQQFGG